MAKKTDVRYIQFATDGSVARQLEQLPHKTSGGKLPEPRKKKAMVLYVDPVALLAIGVAICMVIMMAIGLYQLQQANANVAGKQQQVQELVQQNEQLQEEYRNGYDLEAVERTALALGMVPMEQVPHIALPLEQGKQEQTAPQTFAEQFFEFWANLFA